MKNSTNSFILLFLITFALLLISYGCSETIVNPHTKDLDLIVNSKAKACESFSRTVYLKNQTLLNLKGINGSVNIESNSNINEISILIEKIVRADTYEDAESHLKNVTVDIDELTNEIVITTSQPKYSDGKSYIVNYTIIVPSNLSLKIRNVNGEINGQVIVPLNGTVDISLINGHIELKIPQSTSADFSASLVNGKISKQNLTLHNRAATSRSLNGTFGEGLGIISLKTTNGNIDVLGI